MSSFWLSFRDCGSSSYVIVMLTIVALMDAVVAAVVVFGSKSRQLGIMLSAITLCLGIGIVGVGEYGELSGRARTNDALQNLSGSSAIDTSMRDEIRTEGYKESAECVSIGIGGGALPLIFGLVLLIVAVKKKKSEATAN